MKGLLTFLMGFLSSVGGQNASYLDDRVLCKKILKSMMNKPDNVKHIRNFRPQMAIAIATNTNIYSMTYYLLYRLLLPDKFFSG